MSEVVNPLEHKALIIVQPSFSLTSFRFHESAFSLSKVVESVEIQRAPLY